MQFRTEIVPLNKKKLELTYNNRFFLLGSCFSENIHKKLSSHFFRSIHNPFGTLFNPMSISNSLDEILDEKKYTIDDLIFEKLHYLSLNHNTLFSSKDKDQLISKINTINAEMHEELMMSDVLVLTFGSAWIYKYNKTNKYIANCHKLNPSNFNKELLSISLIIEEYKRIISKTLIFKPSIKILLTLSPVRHWGDGYSENMHSKSILYVAIQELIKIFPQCHYFPSYEILMDDLRDYRFYSDDLLHINDVAVKYIWEKFKDTYFLPETILLIDEASHINQMLSHRTQTPDSFEYKEFIEMVMQRKKTFSYKIGYEL